MKPFPKVMGILNVTPDSFSDGGRFITIPSALLRAHQMVEEGADIIDVGGESTRPRATPPSLQEELDRVIPIIEALKREVPVQISVDTSRPIVMQEALKAGASLINDVRALQIPKSVEVAAKAGALVILMHMQGEPSKMQDAPTYQNVVLEVMEFLSERIKACLEAGILPHNIIIDPGFGFGKTLSHNIQLLRELASFKKLGYPILVGLSRKRIIGEILDVPVEKRLVGSLTLAILALKAGVSILRVHDVRETVEAVKMLSVVGG